MNESEYDSDKSDSFLNKYNFDSVSESSEDESVLSLEDNIVDSDNNSRDKRVVYNCSDDEISVPGFSRDDNIDRGNESSDNESAFLSHSNDKKNLILNKNREKKMISAMLKALIW